MSNLAVTYLTPQNTRAFGSVSVYTISTTDQMLVLTTDAFDTSVTYQVQTLLPLAASNPGRIMIVERKGTTMVLTLTHSGSDLINGVATFGINVSQTMMLVSDGINNWSTLANF